VAALDDATVLDKVSALRHVGPMAQDFYAAFHVGEDDRHITSIDEDGVALAAIEALHAENRTLRAENRALRTDLAELRTEVRGLAAASKRRQGRPKVASAAGRFADAPGLHCMHDRKRARVS